jgi:hypothetical protein
MPENPNPNGPTDQGTKDGDLGQGGQGNPNPNGPEGQEDKGEGGDEKLGEAGVKALQAERDARKEAEATVKAQEAKVTELEAEVKRLQRANAAVKGTDLEAIRTEIRAEFQTQLLEAQIQAEAKGKVQESAEVVTRYPEFFKDLKAGDADGITKAVEKLLAAKKYLAVTSDAPQGWGDVGGGQRGEVGVEPTSPEARLRRAYGASK